MPVPIHELLKRHIEPHRRALSGISRKVGKSSSWLSKILHGKRTIPTEMIDPVLRAAGADPAAFWHDYVEDWYGSRPCAAVLDHQDPALLLRAIRKGREARSETLEAVAGLIYPPLHSEGQYEIDAMADEIDSLRESNPAYALEEAEHWVRTLRMMRLRQAPTPSDTARMATSLGVWGSALRVRGQTHLAAQALELALKLHDKAATASPSYADLLERSAFVIKAFGYVELSVGLIHNALGIISLTDDEYRRSKSILALGIVYLYLGRNRLAEESFLRVLKSPGSDLVRKAGAAVNLVALYERNGDIEKAERILDSLDRWQDSLPITWSSQLQGLRAFLLTRQGHHSKAADLLVGSLQQAWKSLPADRTFVVFLNLAVVLIRAGRHDELLSRAKVQSEMLAHLEDTPSCRRVAAAFIDTLQSQQEVEPSQVEEIRSRFMSALKRDLSARDTC